MAALQLPPLSGQRTPRPDPGVTCILKVGEIQAIHTHRVSSPPIAAVANANWNNAREREGFHLHLGQAKGVGCGQL